MNKFFIKAGMLIDGTGREAAKDKIIYVAEGKIEDVADRAEIPDGTEVFDYAGYTVMPGMINAHIHINDDPLGHGDEMNEVEKVLLCGVNIDKLLNSGVTYVRNLGTGNFVDIKVKGAMEKGLVQKIGMLTSGPCITMTGGHGYSSGIEADGVDECRKAARTVLKNGADVVKIMATGGVMTPGVEPGSAQLSREEIEAAVVEAHKAGKKTATHAQGSQGIKNAVLAGIDSVEHGIFLTDEIIDMMLERGTYLVPTLVAPYAIVQGGEEAGIKDYVLRKAKSVIDAHVRSFRMACERGVNIAMGTDAGTPMNFHDSTWLELKLMTDNGMSPMEAIVASTSSSAKLMGIDNLYGTIGKGKMADIIVLQQNPLINIESLSDVCHVFKEGVAIK